MANNPESQAYPLTGIYQQKDIEFLDRAAHSLEIHYRLKSLVSKPSSFLQYLEDFYEKPSWQASLAFGSITSSVCSVAITTIGGIMQLSGDGTQGLQFAKDVGSFLFSMGGISLCASALTASSLSVVGGFKHLLND